MAVTLYGIRNCDTMKKAWTWLDRAGVTYGFHDYKKQGVERARLEGWARQVGWEVLLNRAGTTFKKLPDADKQGLDEARAIALMLAQPSMIKRPILETGGLETGGPETGGLETDAGLLVGFKPDAYAARFG